MNAYLLYGSGDMVKILSHIVPVQYNAIPCSIVVGEACNYRSLPWLQTYLFIILSGIPYLAYVLFRPPSGPRAGKFDIA